MDGILAAVMFAIRATYHTTNKATPTQLVFQRDAILDVPFLVDWAYQRELKQKRINKNNQVENRARIPHQYTMGDKVLYRVEQESKYGQEPFAGPYVITKVNNNGTVRLRMKKHVTETVNIRLIKPFHEANVP